jgi:hypothetical protein
MAGKYTVLLCGLIKPALILSQREISVKVAVSRKALLEMGPV